MSGLKDGSVQINDAGRLKDYVGKRVTLEGTISRIYWQHVIANPPTHPRFSYFDVGDSQVIIYTKEEIKCKGKLRIEGVVVELGGEKIPSRKKTITEYHVVVDKYERIE